MNRNTNNNRLRESGWTVVLAAVLTAAGAMGLMLGFLIGPAIDAWLCLLISFLFIGGIAQGMIVWAAVFRLTWTRWTPTVNRLGHSAVWMLPLLFIVLIVLLAGGKHYIPWTVHPVPETRGWLNTPFFVIREIVVNGVFLVLCFLLVRRSLQADRSTINGNEISSREHSRMTVIAVAVVICYAITFTIIAWDFIMSLSPDWYSTMFAPYYFTTNAYVSMAALILIAALTRNRLDVGRWLDAQKFHDMGNLMLGFGLFSMGLFFAQYLTIWYGNLPQETFFIVERYFRGPWPILGWTSFILGYAIPFVVLQSRGLKRTPRLLIPVAILAIIGVGLERYVMVVPSVKPADLMLSGFPLLGVAGFIGALILAVVAFLSRYSPVSAADEALPELEERMETVP
jgi:Ni/Fe-hydrogenase subunit HybB-like protein